jgi:hypothetical protein
VNRYERRSRVDKKKKGGRGRKKSPRSKRKSHSERIIRRARRKNKTMNYKVGGMNYSATPLDVVVSSNTDAWFDENDSKTQEIQLHDHLGNETYPIRNFFIMKNHTFIINHVNHYLVKENVPKEDAKRLGMATVFGYVKITDVI